MKKNEEKVPINNEKIINKVEKLDERMAYVTTQLELLLAKEIERNKELQAEREQQAKEQKEAQERWEKEREEREKERAEREKERAEREAEREKERAERDKERKEAQERWEKEREKEREEREKERQYWDHKMYEVNKRIADVTGTLGKSAESEFVFAIENNNNICGGIHFDIIQTNVKKSREYDIVLINNEYVALVEVKWNADIKDIHKLLSEQAIDFRKDMTEYKDKKLVLFIASHVYDKNIALYAIEKGIGFLHENWTSTTR